MRERNKQREYGEVIVICESIAVVLNINSKDNDNEQILSCIYIHLLVHTCTKTYLNIVSETT